MKGKEDWIRGQQYLEIEEDWLQAEYHFGQALAKNSSCADAMLGMYVLDEDGADEWVERMYQARNHFGKLRETTGRHISATWQPLFFAEQPLSSKRDLLLLSGKNQALQGNFRKAKRILRECGPGQDRNRVLAYVFMIEENFSAATRAASNLPEDDPEAALLKGICHYSMQEWVLAREFLLQAEFLGDFYVRRHASYYMALLADEVGEVEEAVRRLEDIAEHSPRYLDTIPLLREIRAETDPFWAIISQLDED